MNDLSLFGACTGAPVSRPALRGPTSKSDLLLFGECERATSKAGSMPALWLAESFDSK